MKYVKLFEKYTIEWFFKDKINWKLLELIEDSATEMLDDGYHVHIRALVSKYRVLYHILPSDKPSLFTGGYQSSNNLSSLIRDYNESGEIQYSIIVYDKDDNSYPNQGIKLSAEALVVKSKLDDVISKVKRKHNISIIESNFDYVVFSID